MTEIEKKDFTFDGQVICSFRIRGDGEILKGLL